ncbi:MFS transporter [Aneurinibacillus tyrosinisolvens]|uniref:MFS transporter n=1 Tax=Aneurinibacillus tyrosinisolvens TaxID=1443435 RepID=UPI00063F28F1|nr:MFS transporter [Aneurinibacillus tyrosinisolvens]
MRKQIGLFFFMMFVIGTDTFLISPLLPTLKQEFHVSTEVSGWMVGAYALGYALFALLAGPLSDGWNRKKVMAYGMLSFAITTALCGFAFNFWSMFAFRFLAGISSAFVSPQVWASIPLLVPQQKIIKSMGLATAGLSVAQLLGVPLGSFLAVYGWSTPFFVIGGASLFLTILIYNVMPNLLPAAPSEKKPSILTRYRDLLTQTEARTAFAAYFAFQLGNFTSFSFIGTFLTTTFGLSLAGVGTAMMLFGFGNLAGSLCGGWIIKKAGLPRTFYTVLSLLVLDYILLACLTSLLYVKISFFIVFVIGGILFPIMMNALQNISPTSRGTIASLSNSIMYGGAAVGSAVAGFLYANWSGFMSVSLFSAACFTASLFLFAGSRVIPFMNVTKKQIASHAE